MRYFVTGATGFIGSALVRQLRTAGHDVVALVRDPTQARTLKALGVELAQGDITDPTTLRKPMGGADGVFHLAAWYRVGGSTRPAYPVNVVGTRNVLDVMKTLGIAKGVYTSTLAVNSNTRGKAVDEAYVFDGQHLSAYDETKWRAHHEVAAPLIEGGLPLVIVMPGVVYGPGDPSQMGGLLREAHAGKRVMLPGGMAACWAHVDDVAHAHVLAMEKGVVGESYIIAGPCHPLEEALRLAARLGGHTLSALPLPAAVLSGMSKVMGMVEKVVPVPAEFSAEAMRATAGVTYLGDNGKARRVLGYAPRTLEDGFRDTFATQP